MPEINTFTGVQLRPLTETDCARIRDWPPYEREMAQMDYALRSGGWLDEFWLKPHTFLYAAEKDADLVGFTILAGNGKREAEFRIALRADQTGLGIGANVALQTLRQGFLQHNNDRIHLIVRTHNRRGIKLYQRLGFADRGACRLLILGVPVDFRRMDLHQSLFHQLHEPPTSTRKE